MGASKIATSSNQQAIKLYQVTIQNLDGSTKTVLKSVPFGIEDSMGYIIPLFDGVVRCVKLTPQLLKALWFSAQADLSSANPEAHSPCKLPTKAARWPVALFALGRQWPANLDKTHAEEVARALFSNAGDFAPIQSFHLFQNETKEEHKWRKQEQNSLSIFEDVLDAALNSDSRVVEAFLKVNAGYLLAKGSATDFSGRKYNDITPLQAAIIGSNLELTKLQLTNLV